MFIFGSSVSVPRDADDETMEKKRLELETAMREITDRADHYWDNG